MANFRRLISPLITKKFNNKLSSHNLQITRKFNNSSILQAHEYYLVKSPEGQNYRLHLAKSRHLLGIRTTRGMREYNDDRYQSMVLEFNKTKQSDDFYNQPILDCENLENEQEVERKEGQICYFSVFDGHGGSQCADYLAAHLHQRIEDVHASDADGIVTKLRSIGGYFRRYKPELLEMLLSTEVADITPKRRPISPNIQKSSRDSSRNFSSSTPTQLQQHLPQSSSQTLAHSILLPATPTIPSSKPLTMKQRLTLAFLKSDIELMNVLQQKSVGSTASTALIRSLDKYPFWTSNNIELTVAHVGDSRILLCEVVNGNSIPLTYDHHPSSTTETDRLGKTAGFVFTDSFGSEMFLGRLANTRAFGDVKMKRFGISAEPEISVHNLIGKNYAFMVLVSDGITSVLSDQEIVDYIKNYDNPTLGASKLVDLAEELGSEDNLTAMVVRLPGWGSPMTDQTKDLRKYRIENDAISYKKRNR